MARSNKPVAVITGSTSGIGRALAEGLVRDGYQVVLNGMGDAGEIATLCNQLAAVHHPANMKNPDEVADLVNSTHTRFGRLDVLINNAGVQHVAAVEDFPLNKWDDIIAVNLSSAFHTIRAAVPHMKAAGQGRILNIASAHALVASPFKSAYVAAKHGIAGLTKSVALELAESRITCNAICPGYVKTPLVDGQIKDQAVARGISEDAVMRDVILAAQPNKRFVEYAELVGLMRYLLSDNAASVNGAMLSIDGGWTAR